MLRSIELQLDSSRDPNSGWAIARTAPSLLVRCDSRTNIATLTRAEGVVRTWRDPLEALSWMHRHVRNQASSGEARWIGYLSYDLGRLFENIPFKAEDDLNLPLFAFGFTVGRALPARNGAGGKCPPGDLSSRHAPPAVADGTREGADQATARDRVPATSTFTRESYCRAVKRVMDYIAAGDVFQVNLSQRFTCTTVEPARAIYQRLLDATPAWYGAYLNFGDHALLCNSPELFLHVRPDRRVITRPIKGTRPRRPGMEAELRHSDKDQAELNMIVDLERNDLGRVCEIGSVRVTEPRVIEAHPTVYHGAATIEGLLRADVTLVDLLRATFPGGSVTGAPKIRAMEIIDELEPVRRGPYCGAIGYLASDGTIQFNVGIRTMIVRGDQIHIPVGGGIVADSDPLAEYEETLVKAEAMLGAIAAPV